MKANRPVGDGGTSGVRKSKRTRAQEHTGGKKRAEGKSGAVQGASLQKRKVSEGSSSMNLDKSMSEELARLLVSIGEARFEKPGSVHQMFSKFTVKYIEGSDGALECMKKLLLSHEGVFDEAMIAEAIRGTREKFNRREISCAQPTSSYDYALMEEDRPMRRMLELYNELIKPLMEAGVIKAEAVCGFVELFIEVSADVGDDDVEVMKGIFRELKTVDVLKGYWMHRGRGRLKYLEIMREKGCSEARKYILYWLSSRMAEGIEAKEGKVTKKELNDCLLCLGEFGELALNPGEVVYVQVALRWVTKFIGILGIMDISVSSFEKLYGRWMTTRLIGTKENMTKEGYKFSYQVNEMFLRMEDLEERKDDVVKWARLLRKYWLEDDARYGTGCELMKQLLSKYEVRKVFEEDKQEHAEHLRVVKAHMAKDHYYSSLFGLKGVQGD